MFKYLVTLIFVMTCFAPFCIGQEFNVGPSKIEWINGDLPGISTTEGEWIWSDQVLHLGAATHLSINDGGLHSHSFITDLSVDLDKETQIKQYVYIDNKERPSGLMIRFYTAEDKELTVYWEDDKEVFAREKEYVTAWYMGTLPDAGSWTLLDIDFKEFDLKKTKLKGASFISSEGKMYWGKTIIVQASN
ncbi:hypothetical protein ACFL0T_03145 [Candidatus Omnitrophota bacterium]